MPALGAHPAAGRVRQALSDARFSLPSRTREPHIVQMPAVVE